MALQIIETSETDSLIAVAQYVGELIDDGQVRSAIGASGRPLMGVAAAWQAWKRLSMSMYAGWFVRCYRTRWRWVQSHCPTSS